jgi:2'-5' RNA ligase
MSKRLFLAIPLSEELKNIIVEKQLLIDPSLHWIPRENLHITLHFFGKTEEDVIPSLIEKIDKVIKNSPPFHLYTKEIGTQSGKFQKMVWVKFTPSPEFAELSRKIAEGLQMELTRKPLAHINLIRIKDKKISLNILAAPMILTNETAEVKQVELWESILMPGKFPTYKALHRFILNGREEK